jgi:hypothetical protein
MTQSIYRLPERIKKLFHTLTKNSVDFQTKPWTNEGFFALNMTKLTSQRISTEAYKLKASAKKQHDCGRRNVVKARKLQSRRL